MLPTVVDWAFAVVMWAVAYCWVRHLLRRGLVSHRSVIVVGVAALVCGLVFMMTGVAGIPAAIGFVPICTMMSLLGGLGRGGRSWW